MKYVILSSLAAALDQAVKACAERNRDRFPGMVRNRGFARNRMEDRPDLVAGVSVLGTAGIAAMLFAEKGTGKPGWALVLGGAISNTADRLVRRYVVDYIPLGKYVYNLADCFIYLGLLMILSDAALGRDQNMSGAE